jgi:GNAT superfamily N-acetyltransferase
MDSELTVVPACDVGWQELEQVVGRARCHGGPCWCQRFKVPGAEWAATPASERARRFREEVEEGTSYAPTTGLVALEEGQAVGWCNVEPRSVFDGLRGSRVPWVGRTEDRDDDTVWAITCFLTRPGRRRRGTTYRLAREAVELARQHGARAVEGYARITEPGAEVAWGDLHVGSRNAFAAAGLAEVSRPSRRRAVMRVEL